MLSREHFVNPIKCIDIYTCFLADFSGSCLGLLLDLSWKCLGNEDQSKTRLRHDSEKSGRRPRQVPYLSQRKRAYFSDIFFIIA